MGKDEQVTLIATAYIRRNAMAYTRYPGLFIRRGEDSKCCYNEKSNIIRLHSLFNRQPLGTKTAIEVIDSHRSYPYYDKKHDVIVFDSHFCDILRIVTAALFSGSSEYMDVLAYACAADYFLCKDEVYIAFNYANRFAREKESIEKLTIDGTKSVFNRQLLFVLGHEQGHALLAYDKNDERFRPFRYYFDTEYTQISDATKAILSIDLSPIKNDLDKLDRTAYVDPFDYSEKNISALIKHSLQLSEVVQKGVSLLNVTESDAISKEMAVFYACDYYLKGGGIKLLERDRYESDCIIDGYTLQRLISCNFNNEDTLTQMKETVFAYFSCLLTMDIITCVNACVMNVRAEGYKAEDLVWNRLRLEREMFNNVVLQYAFRKPFGFIIAHDVFEYSKQLAEQYSFFYARFCDRIFAVEHPTESTPYYPYGSTEYETLYSNIYTMLKINW